MDLLHEERFDARSEAWHEFLPTLAKQKLAMIIVFLATILSAYATVEFVLPEDYESEAQLLVKLGRENAEVPATVQNSALFTPGIRQQELNSEIQMLTSQSLAERVVDKLGPDAFKFTPAPPKTLFQAVKYYAKKSARYVKDQFNAFLILVNLKKQLSDRNKAILAVQAALRVEPEKDSDVIAVRVRLPAPDLAVQVTQSSLDFYFDDHIRVRRGENAKEFFDQLVDDNRDLLLAADKTREEIRQKWGISSIPEQRSLLLKRLSDLNDRLAADQNQKAALLRQQDVMRARLPVLSDNLRSSQVVTPNPLVQSIKERLTTLQLERARLLNLYTEDSQLIRNIDGEIATIEALRKGEDESRIGSITSELNPLKQSFTQSVEEIDARIAGLEAGIAENRQLAAALEKQLKVLNQAEDVLERVERERRMAEQDYLSYSKHREQARVSEELDLRRVANVTVLSPPSRPINPVSPKKLLIMGVAVCAGLLLSISFALFLEYLRNTIDSSRDLAGIEGIPLLGVYHAKQLRSGSRRLLPGSRRKLMLRG